MNPLIQKLKKYGPLSEDAELALAKRTKHLRKRKHEHLLKQGQTLSSYFLIEKGLIRGYFYSNNKEVNAWFGVENEVYASILPVYANLPSLENIEFLEDSIVYAIAVDDLNELYRLYPELNLIGRKIAEEVCILLEERINSLHTESATERYRWLINKYPYLLQRVSLGHIASYLGITQETLSRIRKQ